jgi:hypothetical protein
MFASTSPRVQARKIPLQLLIRLLTPALLHHTGSRVRSCHGVNKLHHHTHSPQGTNSTQACLLGCSPLPPSPSHSFLPALATKSSAVKLEKFRRLPSVQLPDKDQSLQRYISRIYRRTASTTNAPERQKPHAQQKHCRFSAPAPYSSKVSEPDTEPQKPDLTTSEREIVLIVLPNLIPDLRNQT